MKKVILASGSGRCGTQTFGAQMGQLKGVYSFHEGMSMWVNIRKICPVAPHLCFPDSFNRSDYNRKALWFRREKYLVPAPVGYAEAAHYFAPSIEHVEDVFPEAKIIHLYRDPLEAINSYIFHAGREIYRNGTHVRSLEDWKRWHDCYPLDSSIKTRAEGFAFYWQLANEKLAGTNLPRLFVPTVELSSDATWKKILEFAELEGEIKTPGQVWNRRQIKNRIPVTPAVRAAVEKHCKWRP